MVSVVMVLLEAPVAAVVVVVAPAAMVREKVEA
jgi:hypothetical protein